MDLIETNHMSRINWNVQVTAKLTNESRRHKFVFPVFPAFLVKNVVCMICYNVGSTANLYFPNNVKLWVIKIC